VPASFDLVGFHCCVTSAPTSWAVLAGVRACQARWRVLFRRCSTPIGAYPKRCSVTRCLYVRMPQRRPLLESDFQQLAPCRLPRSRLVSDRPLAITGSDPERAPPAPLRFFSPPTQRLFAIDGLEEACEGPRPGVIYQGGIAAHPPSFPFDKHHRIEAGGLFPVCATPSEAGREAATRPLSSSSAASIATTAPSPLQVAAFLLTLRMQALVCSPDAASLRICSCC